MFLPIHLIIGQFTLIAKLKALLLILLNKNLLCGTGENN